MTVIAFDGKTVAADRLAVQGGGIGRSVTKIERFANCVLAITGGWDIGAELREWFKAGAVPADFPAKARDGDATLIVFDPDAGHVRTFNSGPYDLPMLLSRCAFGSGRDYAEAAMHLGCNAVRAVEVASHFQTDCGMGVDTLDL